MVISGVRDVQVAAGIHGERGGVIELRVEGSAVAGVAASCVARNAGEHAGRVHLENLEMAGVIEVPGGVDGHPLRVNRGFGGGDWDGSPSTAGDGRDDELLPGNLRRRERHDQRAE
jgi:hypothetical protein